MMERILMRKGWRERWVSVEYGRFWPCDTTYLPLLHRAAKGTRASEVRLGTMHFTEYRVIISTLNCI